MVICENIRKTYGGRAVLDGISLRIAPGKITALMGPTGAGKTTLLRVAALVDPPDVGQVSIGDQEYRYPSEAQNVLRPWPNLSIVFQDLLLWPHMTNRENVLLAARKRLGDRASDALRMWAERLDLGNILDRFPNEVSRGERQLVAITRAIVLEPKYLFLDEVSASLDLARSVRIAEVLRDLASEGVGMLLVTHQIGFTRHTADYLAYLDNGRLVEEGAVSVIDQPRSSEFKSYLELVRKTI